MYLQEKTMRWARSSIRLKNYENKRIYAGHINIVFFARPRQGDESKN